PVIFALKGMTIRRLQMPESIAPTFGRWLVYNTSVWLGVKENGSLYFFSAKISSVEQSCLMTEVFRRIPSSSSAAIIRRFPFTSASSGFTFRLQPTVNASADILPLYVPSTRAMVFQKV